MRIAAKAKIQRRGSANRTILVLISSLVALGVLIASVLDRRPHVNSINKKESQEPLVVYCAASNKGVLEAIRADYEKDFGTAVQVQYGASQTLLAAMQVASAGDLYLPADDSYLKLAAERKLLAEEFPLATMNVVVGVAKGNPKKIERLADLLRADVRLAQANPDAAAVGKLTREALSASGDWEKLQARTLAFKTNVNEVANDIKVGGVDAGIIYEAMLHDYDTLEGVVIPELAKVQARVSVATLEGSRQPQAARRLARYLSSSDKGLARYREFGFHVAEGKPWSEQAERTGP